uniref:Methionine aminopeptidase n=1 Tax=Leersia perrieri TaxID=77586 RepID=A0A0D9VLC8_9ORYZ
MATSSSPRLLSSFLGDRLLSARPVLHGNAPGSRRAAYQATRTLCNLVDILFNRGQSDKPGDNPRRLRPGKLSPRLSVPNHIQRPPYVNARQRPGLNNGPEIHDERGIECMRASGKLAAQVLKFAGTLVKPGITTDEIDKAVHQMIVDNGAYPSPLGYCGFPKSVCTSVNECICHGIPDSRPLEDGDIINIDVTVYLNGYHGDTSATFLCGDVDDRAKKLVQVTRECLDKAISICAPGVEIKHIGRTIQDHADKFKFGVVRQFVGHGVGQVFHAEPVVLHFRNNEWGRMTLNQTFTIEPMLTVGSINPVIWSDDWTAVTEDGSLSAQFEHTILITEDGAEILTQCEEVVQYTEEQIRKAEESIRIRREAEPVELVEAVKNLRKIFRREEKRRKELPLELKQKVSYEIMQLLRDLGDNSTFAEQHEAVESWRLDKLKDIRSASIQNSTKLDLSNEEARILKRALQFNWHVLMEDIGRWIPLEVSHTEHDDKPENEPEEEEIIAGPPLPSQCNAELHTDYDGAAVRWGLTHPKESAADCCQACLDQAKNAKPGELRCNIWVYCPSEFGCFSPDKYEHKHQECWLKQADHPKLNFKDKYSESYRNSHPTAPVVVPWMSGVIST